MITILNISFHDMLKIHGVADVCMNMYITAMAPGISFLLFFAKKPPVPASFLLICLYIRQPEDYMPASG